MTITDVKENARQIIVWDYTLLHAYYNVNEKHFHAADETTFLDDLRL